MLKELERMGYMARQLEALEDGLRDAVRKLQLNYLLESWSDP